MDNETGKQGTSGTEPTNQDKTFTQDELNAIVQDRLKREREKYADYDSLKDKATKFDQTEEANKSELQKSQEIAASLKAELDALKNANSIRDIRVKVAQEMNVPENLLSADNEEDCKLQAEAILKFAKPDGYPSVKDKGETRPAGEQKTRDQFADFFNESLKK